MRFGKTRHSCLVLILFKGLVQPVGLLQDMVPAPILPVLQDVDMRSWVQCGHSCWTTAPGTRTPQIQLTNPTSLLRQNSSALFCLSRKDRYLIQLQSFTDRGVGNEPHTTRALEPLLQPTELRVVRDIASQLAAKETQWLTLKTGVKFLRPQLLHTTIPEDFNTAIP